VLVTREGQVNKNGDRGILPKPFEFRERELYKADTHLPTPEEGDVFEALGLPYIPPPMRSVGMYQNWAARRDRRERPTAWLREFGFLNQPTVGLERQRGDDVWWQGRQYLLQFREVGAEGFVDHDANRGADSGSLATVESGDRAGVLV
jgi:hypothetical protein